MVSSLASLPFLTAPHVLHTAQPEGLKNANQLFTSVQSKIRTVACKSLLASSPSPLRRPADFFSLLNREAGTVSEPCSVFPFLILSSQLRPLLRQLS